MKKEDLSVVLAISSGLLGSIVSDLIADRLLRVVFVVAVMAGVGAFFVFYGSDDKQKKNVPYLCASLAIVILLVSVFGNGMTAGDILQHVGGFFITQTDETAADDGLRRKISAANQEMERLLERADCDSLRGKLEQAQDSAAGLSKAAYHAQFWKDRADQQEVAAILSTIKERAADTYSNGDKAFPDLLTDEKMVEFFYKMRLSESTWEYYYCNIIKAMEGYGIDCEGFGINEFTLAEWDADVLFMDYKMRRSLAFEQPQEGEYEKDWPQFNDYKVLTSDSDYSDDLDYGNWYLEFSAHTKICDMVEDRDNSIWKYYDKWQRNFGGKED